MVSYCTSFSLRASSIPPPADGNVSRSPHSHVADDELEIEDFAWDDAKKVSSRSLFIDDHSLTSPASDGAGVPLPVSVRRPLRDHQSERHSTHL